MIKIYQIDQSLEIEADLKEVVTGADVVCMVVPSHGYRAVFKKLIHSTFHYDLAFSVLW